MLVLVKREPTRNDLAAWLATIPGFIQGLMSVDERPVRLYDYQVEFMRSEARFRAVVKSRQTGFSFSYAAEALAKAHLSPGHMAIFVSYNLEDAKEKIRYADMLYESMPEAWRLKRVTDNKTELEFVDRRGRRSRLVSLPCREPRGKGKADLYLDELSFYRNARRIYSAAVPVISRGGGVLTVGSTPLGQTDIFYEIITDTQRYPHFHRFTVPWWECPEFCTDVTRAKSEAAGLSTDDRVERFGTPILREIRASLDLQSFQQEYECVFVDEATAYLPWELITACARDSDELPVARSVDEFLSAEVRGPLWAGYDVGRRRNAAELIVVEQVGERYHVRLMQTLDRQKFSLQRETLALLLERRRDVVRLCIDATGVGMQLAEELEDRFPGRVEGVEFTSPVKMALGTTLKIAMEERNVLIPADRDLMLQLHSVRKTVTAAGNVRLDTDHDEKHHADKFWALALALHAGKAGGRPASPQAVEALRSLSVYG